MELAAALHHSRDARSEVAHEALRGQKTASSGTRPEPLEEVSEPQVGAVTVGYVAAPVPFLSSPVLADTAAEAVDARTVKFLLSDALKSIWPGGYFLVVNASILFMVSVLSSHGFLTLTVLSMIFFLVR